MKFLLVAGLAFIREASALEFSLLVLSLVAAASVCGYFGFAALYRSRLIADTPTSKLRSAAQGYVELQGRARMMPGEPVYAPLSGKPCVWYAYVVEKKAGRNEEWGTLESGVSEAIFHLADETGVCVVDPDGADVTPSVTLRWRGDSPRPLYTPKETSFWSQVFSFGDYRYTERRLNNGDVVYAIGQFHGAGGFDPPSVGGETRDLLATWKKDRVGLLQRFDTDRDGKIDLEEWEAARQAAEQEVVATWSERQPPQMEINLLNKPPYGRPYIIAAGGQEALLAACRRRATLWLAGSFLWGLALAWVVRDRFSGAGEAL